MNGKQIIKKAYSVLKDYRYFLNTFMVILLVLLIPFVLVIMVYYFTTVNEIRQGVYSANEKEMSSVEAMADNILSATSNTGYYMSIMPSIETFCAFGRSRVSNTDIQNIYDQIGFVEATNRVIDSVWIYSMRTDSFFESGFNVPLETIEKTKDWAEDLIQSHAGEARFVHNVKYDIYPSLLTFYTPIVVNNGVVGAVLININSEELTELFSVAQESEFSILYGNEPIYSTDIDLPRQYDAIDELYPVDFVNDAPNSIRVLEASDTLITQSKGTISGINYMLTSDLTSYSSLYDSLPMLLPTYFVLAVTVAFVFSSFVTLQVTRPFSKVAKELNRNNKASGDDRFEKDIVTEIINSIRENDDLHDLLAIRMNLLQNAQYMALQTQINPHFLYNTLETIKWNAVELTGGDNTASQSIQDLGKLLRYSLTMNPQFTTVEEEVANLCLYLKIVNARFEEKIDVVWDFDVQVLNCKIPRLLLQPIIENSISHGLRYSSQKKQIKISCEEIEERLRFSIIDNGSGILPEALTELNEKLENMNVFTDRHIGLLNVAQRIRLTYGDHSFIKVMSTAGEGTTVVIEFERS